MHILVVGAGGVGAAVAAIARHRPFFAGMVLSDLDADRAAAAAARANDPRITGVGCDASDADALVDLIADREITHVLNACDPRLNPPIFAAARRAGVTYLDMAMTLSERHPQEPFSKPGVMLGDAQFAEHEAWEQDGQLALVGIGVEPGASDVFARHAADTMFDTIDEIGVRDGADLEVRGYAFAPTFSIWTTIEECLNPPLIWERERGFYVTEPFSEPEIFEFPEGIGPVECVNVEHEEVVLIPRWVDCNRVTFKYGLGEEFIGVLRTLHLLGLDSTEPIDVRGQQVSPRDVVAAALPNPADLGDRMTGRTCAGTLVTGTGKDGKPRATYLYHLVDNERTMRQDGCQAVVWQTAINPVIALELLQSGSLDGCRGPGPGGVSRTAVPRSPGGLRVAPRRAGARRRRSPRRGRLNSGAAQERGQHRRATGRSRSRRSPFAVRAGRPGRIVAVRGRVLALDLGGPRDADRHRDEERGAAQQHDQCGRRPQPAWDIVASLGLHEPVVGDQRRAEAAHRSGHAWRGDRRLARQVQSNAGHRAPFVDA